MHTQEKKRLLIYKWFQPIVSVQARARDTTPSIHMFMSGFKDFNPSRQEGSLEFLTSSDQIQMFGDKTRHKTVTLSQ